MREFIKKSSFSWLITLLPLLIELFCVPYSTWHERAFWKQLLLFSGFSALSFLVFVLALHPLTAIFKKNQWLKLLNRHRRQWGLACFYYAFFHMCCYLLMKQVLYGRIDFKYFLHPVIFPALIAIFLLLILAVTSNNASIRFLKYKAWKKLHKLTYVVEGLIFFHILLQGGWSILWAFLFFVPLVFLQKKRSKLKR
ncbi:MAG: Protein-methionine-sulfoxide reductase heme-binding subunit MsrQ [Chlamydiia bacterium]|nr:Protein-methionine-sulfoxide reductase heme-binding subunit MsrQ [Chlamydiia bacterium]MCH9615389.1 Protein-methionine-sulfoxide reductase heme-binding subunit MsrQ [Chlamydiia bacterium]MCH9628289.1 Protein-methionine-sulfoxide reductase heme-binding subunit MsrQ [Chlamydiia bacterium]